MQNLRYEVHCTNATAKLAKNYIFNKTMFQAAIISKNFIIDNSVPTFNWPAARINYVGANVDKLLLKLQIRAVSKK